MPTNLIDLLPEESRHSLRQDYFFRLGTVVVIVLALLVVSAGALLIPTYVYLTGEVQTKAAHLANIESGLKSADEAALSARLDALSQDAVLLSALGSSSSATGVIRSFLVVARPGVSIANVSYQPGIGKIAGVLVVSGTAATRDSLRAYQLALQHAPFAANVDLPVSAFAKDTNIGFTITITLAP